MEDTSKATFDNELKYYIHFNKQNGIIMKRNNFLKSSYINLIWKFNWFCFPSIILRLNKNLIFFYSKTENIFGTIGDFCIKFFIRIVLN